MNVVDPGGLAVPHCDPQMTTYTLGASVTPMPLRPPPYVSCGCVNPAVVIELADRDEIVVRCAAAPWTVG